MYSPIELLLDPVSLVIIGMYALLWLWESFRPARQLPKVKFWKLKGITAFAVFFYLSSYLPILVDPLLERVRLFDLSSIGVLPGALVGVFLYELLLYFWHWAIHKFDFLWRVFHQMHHSAERLDTVGAFFFSPMDMIGFTLIGSICFALLIGLSPQAITVVLLTTNFFSIFQHANIKTSHWLGYFIQRPESHSIHHAKGIHRYNYADIPVFDMLFGTFINPKSYEKETGFYVGASSRIWEMLAFKTVDKPPKQ